MRQIVAFHDLPAAKIDHLIQESESAGLNFLRRMSLEWESGTNRFSAAGENLFYAVEQGQIQGICGLNVDPYSQDPTVGRVRRLYVAEAHRNQGVGRSLVQRVIAEAQQRFHRLHLRTNNPIAGRFYERLGFAVVCDVPETTHRLVLTDGS